MDPLVLERAPDDQSGKARFFSLRAVLLLLFLAQSVLVCVNSRFQIAGQGIEPLLRMILLTLALLTTCATLARRLPLQNVALALALILLITSAVLILIKGIGRTHLPPTLWLGPPVAALVMLVSRGVARLILRTFRDRSIYGFWLLGLTAGLAVVSFNLWASRLWLNTLRGWPGSFKDVAAFTALAALIAIASTPALIDKRPGKVPPPELAPLLVWTALTLVALLS